LSTIASRLQRTVRSSAQASGKLLNLTLEGEHTEVDRILLEELTEPLLHLLRNAVAHGIETPEERRDRDKPEQGRIVVKAVREGNHIVLSISDDGAGIDPDRVRAAAVARGLVRDAEEAAALDDESVLELLFRPGFSLAEQVDELA